MCLAVPGKVTAILDEERGIARVDVAGVPRTVNIGLLVGDERPGVGDYVVVHTGFALSRITEEEALETERALEQLGQAYYEDMAQLEEPSVEWMEANR